MIFISKQGILLYSLAVVSSLRRNIFTE